MSKAVTVWIVRTTKFLQKWQPKKNSWTRWHPPSPVLELKSKIDQEWLESLESRAKAFHDPTTVEGDIVKDRLRRIKLSVTKYKCPFCNFLAKSRELHLVSHIATEHLYGRVEALKFAKSAKEIETQETLRDVILYYQVIKFRKIIPVPKSPEIDIRKQIQEGARLPTPKEREKHDLEMQEWRRKMMKTRKLRPEQGLTLYPNGTYVLEGASKNWWYCVPQVWESNTKKWRIPSRLECRNWLNLKQPKRILWLLTIVKEEEI